uniref:LRR containing protein n=1 Tax=Panagrolaimus davidi TaxID=227884 RepID=A0A914P4Q2_9BILA
MPKLCVDILRETFYEIVKRYGFKWLDNFMMSGRQPYEFPTIDYKPGRLGTEIPANMLLFKPISMAFAFNMATLDLRNFSPALIPMLKAIHERMQKVCIRYTKNRLKILFETSVDLSDTEKGITLRLCSNNNFSIVLKSCAVLCRKLTIKHAKVDTIFEEMSIYTSDLHNVRVLTIEGNLIKKLKCLKDVVRFVTFISTTFPNLETFDATISAEFCENNVWKWNDISSICSNIPSDIKGCIIYKNSNSSISTIDEKKHPDIEIEGDECCKKFAVTDDFSLKFVTKLNPIIQTRYKRYRL